MRRSGGIKTERKNVEVGTSWLPVSFLLHAAEVQI